MELIISIVLIVMLCFLIFLPILIYFVGKLILPIIIGVVIALLSPFRK